MGKAFDRLLQNPPTTNPEVRETSTTVSTKVKPVVKKTKYNTGILGTLNRFVRERVQPIAESLTTKGIFAQGLVGDPSVSYAGKIGKIREKINQTSDPKKKADLEKEMFKIVKEQAITMSYGAIGGGLKAVKPTVSQIIPKSTAAQIEAGLKIQPAGHALRADVVTSTLDDVEKQIPLIPGKYQSKVLKGLSQVRGKTYKNLGELSDAVNQAIPDQVPFAQRQLLVQQSLQKAGPLADPDIAKTFIPKMFEPNVQVRQQETVQRIIDALKEAKPIRESQEAIYSKIRSERLGKAMSVGQRVSGEKGFFAQKGALKGELPKVEFGSLRGKILQQDIDEVMTRIRQSPKLQGFKQITAQEGMAKLFGQYGGEVPTRGELSLLSSEFGDDFVKVALEKRPLLIKMQEAGYQAINLPRAMMATGDLSAPLRQGIFMVSKPKQFLSSFVKMFKYAGSEKAYQGLQQEISQRPTYELMGKNKLALTSMDDALNTREEAFISNWSEKIPLFGKIARASNRAYSGFLNKLRADVFDDLVKNAEKQGVNLNQQPEVARNIARLVNAGTGRGELPASVAKHAVALNGIFFSPRLMASRLQLLNPVFYAKLDPYTRKQALGMFVRATASMASVIGLSKLAGAEVGTDSRSADFGKIKLGNTRVDLLGGFQQYIKLASQLMSGQVVSSTTGKVIQLGEGYKPMTRLDIIGRFLESKEAPVPSFLTGLVRGQDSIGRQFDVPREIADRFYPILWGDLKDLYNEQGPEMGTALTALATLGAGVQTYGPGMLGTTTSPQADSILRESKYQPSEVGLTLNDSKTDNVFKLKGDDAKKFRSEIMEATVQGILQAKKYPDWNKFTDEEKYEKVKYLVSKQRSKVRDRWEKVKFKK